MDFCSLNDDRGKTVFWDVTAFGLIEMYGRFGGACFLHHQDRRMRRIGKYTRLQTVQALPD